ncbi:TIR domain protein [Klebsiella electrica]|uniref:toll/interleukin-1 receptor domain-containing protein n=1 Tax=Klebsiella electrica TaxID=1259973 RepID=UPI001164AE75|nr:toll/interleukin-1 receptor domain-containing protein [Klebsiella electrica]QDI10527.1 TIR domain protein [Klebsiella electrica]
MFISHSSKDKLNIVNPLNAYLQANDIATWLDSYEIDYGDNIFIKVNEGIEESAVGLFVLTDNFFNSESGWPLAEFSTFFTDLMKSNKKVLMLDAGVSPKNMLGMMKAYRYISWNNGASLPGIANAINKIIKR